MSKSLLSMPANLKRSISPKTFEAPVLLLRILPVNTKKAHKNQFFHSHLYSRSLPGIRCKHYEGLDSTSKRHQNAIFLWNGCALPYSQYHMERSSGTGTEKGQPCSNSAYDFCWRSLCFNCCRKRSSREGMTEIINRQRHNAIWFASAPSVL